jgi:hypothetical protein
MEFGKFNSGEMTQQASNGKPQARLVSTALGTNGIIEVSCLYFVTDAIASRIEAGQTPQQIFGAAINTKKIGTFESFSPFYAGQAPVQSADGDIRLKSGKQFFRTNALVDSDVADDILMDSPVAAEVAQQSVEEAL